MEPNKLSSIVIETNTYKMAQNYAESMIDIISDLEETDYDVINFGSTLKKISIGDSKHIRKMFSDGSTFQLIPDCMSLIDRPETDTRDLILKVYHNKKLLCILVNDEINY